MKIYKNLTILSVSILAVLVPLLVSANVIPAFPMAFWGNVSINSQPAPINTVIRAYYGDVLAGQAIVKESGIYGYSESTRQKLLVSEGSGIITFTFQSATLNGNVETKGIATQSYPAFNSGATNELNLSFSTSQQTSTTGGSTSSVTSSSGGGGGGGGGGSYTPSVTTTSILSVAAQKVDANKDNKVDVLDFVSLMANWGKTGSSVVADFNGDNKVDVLDFVMLMVNWTK